MTQPICLAADSTQGDARCRCHAAPAWLQMTFKEALDLSDRINRPVDTMIIAMNLINIYRCVLHMCSVCSSGVLTATTAILKA